MTFDPVIGLGSIITLAVMICGGVGAWFTLRAEFQETARRIVEVEKKQADFERDLQAHRLHLSETYVRRDDLEKLEDRLAKLFGNMIESIGKRMDTVEYQLRNIDTKILSFLTMKARERE